MFNHHNNQNGALDMKPLMVMPNGQAIFMEQPQSYSAGYFQSAATSDAPNHKAHWLRLLIAFLTPF